MLLRRHIRQKKIELNGWINIVEVDLLLREKHGRTISGSPKRIWDSVRKKRNDRNVLEKIINKNIQDMPILSVRAGYSIYPNYLAAVLQMLTPEEIKRFRGEYGKLVGNILNNEFYLRYGIWRWFMVRSKTAKEEGIEKIINTAFSSMGVNDVEEVESVLFSFGSIVVENLRPDSNMMEDALSLFRLSGVKKYLSDYMDVNFYKDGPQTIEEVLRAHPNTKELFNQEELTFEGEDQIAFDLLKQIGEVKVPDISEPEELSFKKAKELFLDVASVKYYLEKSLTEVRKPMNTTKSLNEMLSSRYVPAKSLYDMLRLRYQKELAERLWKDEKLAREFKKMFPNAKQFWGSEKSLLQIYMELDRAFLDVDQNDPVNPGGIDLNPTHLSLNMRGANIEMKIPVDLQYLLTEPIEGFLPVIINIAPITNLPMLLGEKNQSDQDQFS